MLVENFKQKYFLYCTNCVTDKILPNKFGSLENKLHLCRIKITENDI